MRIRDWSSDVCSSDLAWRLMALGSAVVRVLLLRAGRLLRGEAGARAAVGRGGVHPAALVLRGHLYRHPGAEPGLRGADLALAAAHRGAGGLRILHRLPAGVRAHVHAPGPAQPADAGDRVLRLGERVQPRSEEHTSELQSLMRISYAVFCLTKKNN